jgi:hypothetical protein
MVFPSLNFKEDVEVFQDVREYIEFLESESSDNLFLRPKVKQLEREYMKDRVPLGCSDNEYSGEIITRSFNIETFRILISADHAGSGKTVLGGNIACDYLPKIKDSKGRSKYHEVLFDSKPELHTRKKVNHNAYQLSRLDRLKNNYYTPSGCENLIQVSPMFLKKRVEGSRSDLFVKYDIRDIELEDLYVLFNLYKGRGTSNVESRVEVLKSLVRGNKITSKEVMDILEKRSKASVLRNKLDNMMYLDILGAMDNPVNVVDLLNQGYIVDYVTGMVGQTAFKEYSMGYLGIELRRIIQARKNFKYRHVKPENKPSISLSRPVVLYVTEFDTYCPGGQVKPSTKMMFNDLYNQDRYLGVGVIADTPNFSQVDYTAIKQSNVVLSFKIGHRECKRLQTAKYLSDLHVHQLQSLKCDDKYPNECALIDENVDYDKKLTVFYPLPPLSNLS